MASSFERNIRRIQREMKQKTVEAMNDIVDDLKSKSVPLAPIDTGRLRRSCKTLVFTRVDSVIGNISFNRDYAVKQHENMFFNHPRGGQAKYLEQPLNQNLGKYKNILRDKLREVTE